MPVGRRSLEEKYMKHYKGELPQSDFHWSTHLKWEEENSDDWLTPAKAYSKILEVYWGIDIDSDGNLALYLNDMRVGCSSYCYPSIPRNLAERCEDIIRKDYSAYLRMLKILEESRNLA